MVSKNVRRWIKMCTYKETSSDRQPYKHNWHQPYKSGTTLPAPVQSWSNLGNKIYTYIHMQIYILRFITIETIAFVLSIHWNRNVIILTKFSAQVVLEVVLTTSAVHKNFIKKKNLSFNNCHKREKNYLLANQSCDTVNVLQNIHSRNHIAHP